MFIADAIIKIKNYPGYEVENGMLEELDLMLDRYEVAHFFSLGEGDDEGIAVEQDVVAWLLYEEKDSEIVYLIVALWMKAIRKIPDDKIRKSMLKLLAH